ncbi:hypothetical protein ACFLR2_00845 [Chlamydiota bacterium]
MSQTISMEAEESPKQEQEEIPNQQIDSFLKEIDNLPSPEEKLKVCIAYMRDSLAQAGNPNFKGFWEVRKICLPLFKENLAPALRTQLWADYIELTREGRRLKNLLDEETAFAVEQINLAIDALESEVKGYHAHIEEILEKTPDVDFPLPTHSLEDRFSLYQKLQKQLNLLNLYAARINALRKELIRTEMRIRQKNKFFQSLSQLGDQVFPARKELIRTISEMFMEDVTAFVDGYFSEENFNEAEVRRSVFLFRTEIKNLQIVAKILTLNTHAFSATREMLSGCWDKLKGMEKELKKEYAEHRQKSSENAIQLQQRIEGFMKAQSENPFSMEEGIGILEEISRDMREVQLTRNDVHMLKDLLRQAREPLEAVRDGAERERRQKEAEFDKARQEKVESFKLQLETLQKDVAVGAIDVLTHELEEVRKALQTLSITKAERQHLERSLKVIRDQIAERQSQAVLSLSADDRAALEDLEAILEQRTERRKEIKSQIEEYRKVMGGSGLDFEKAMRYGELMETEKLTLAKIDESIAEIKKKMHDLKKSK